MKKTNFTLSICCPVHNEEGNLEELIKRIQKTINPLFKRDWELLLINDGSNDNSKMIIKKLQKHHHNIVLVNHPKNKGEATAWTTAFKKAKGEIIVILAADLQSPPEEIPKLLDIVLKKGYDVGTGKRVKRKDGLFYWLATRILNLYTSSFFGLKNIQDVSSSFFVVKVDYVKKLQLLENDHRYILPIFKQRGASIKEVSFKHYPRLWGKAHYTKFKSISAIPEIFRFTVRFYYKSYKIIL